MSGEVLQIGDSVKFGEWKGTVEEMVTDGCPQWNEYWKDATGEGVLLVGPKFGARSCPATSGGVRKRITKDTGFLDREGRANVYPLLMISE